MMTRYLLVSIGSMVITLWGIAHLVPTKTVVSGFGTISGDNRKIITMEWITEGLTLCFIGLLVLLVTLYAGPQNLVSVLVYKVAAWMLVAMAGLTFVTGAKTSIALIKVSPLVKSIVAILFFLGSSL